MLGVENNYVVVETNVEPGVMNSVPVVDNSHSVVEPVAQGKSVVIDNGGYVEFANGLNVIDDGSVESLIFGVVVEHPVTENCVFVQNCMKQTNVVESVFEIGSSSNCLHGVLGNQADQIPLQIQHTPGLITVQTPTKASMFSLELFISYTQTLQIPTPSHHLPHTQILSNPLLSLVPPMSFMMFSTLTPKQLLIHLIYPNLANLHQQIPLGRILLQNISNLRWPLNQRTPQIWNMGH